MALLMLTFKMAEQFKSKGIKVNALQINRVKLSKETILKLSPFYRVLAKLQNLTNPLPTGMADNYYQLCTSQDYKDATGQLFNHKREAIQPSTSEKGFVQVKNIVGSRSYPKYAIDPVHAGVLWDLCMELTAGD